MYDVRACLHYYNNAHQSELFHIICIHTEFALTWMYFHLIHFHRWFETGFSNKIVFTWEIVGVVCVCVFECIYGKYCEKVTIRLT